MASSEDDTFQHGAIKRISCRNFMSYDKMVYFADPRLNFILGPNGSGKSTIACAVFLVMGGHLQVLGRSQDLLQYIKHGCQRASVEVEVVNRRGKANSVFRRTLDSAGKNVSQFYLNGEKVSLDRIRREVDYYYIQVENLCQFLPQEKVQFFAKLSSHDLMIATQNATGSVGLGNLYDELVDLSVQIKDSSGEKNRLQRKIESTQAVIEQLRGEVAAQEVRLRVVKTLQFLELVKADVLLEREKLKQREAVERVAAAEEELWKKKMEIRGVEDAEKETVGLRVRKGLELKEARTAFQRGLNQVKQLHQEMELNMVSPEQFQKELDDAVSHNARLDGDAKVIESEIVKATATIAQKQTELIDLRNRQASQDNRTMIEEFQKLDEDLAVIEGKLGDVQNRCNLEMGQLARLRDASNQRLRGLKQHNPDIYSAYAWFETNKSNLGFSGEVFGCLAAQMTTDAKHAKFVEDAIKKRDLVAFFGVNPADIRKLSVTLRDQLKLKSATVLGMPLVPPQEPGNIGALKKYGFTNFVIDLIECHPTVRKFLCLKYQLDQIPIGTEKVDRCLDAIVAETGLRRFYSPNTRYMVNCSSYSGNKWLDTGYIEDARYLANCGAGVEAEVAQVESRLVVLRSKEAELKQERDGTLARKNRLEPQINAVREEKMGVKRCEQEIRNLRARIQVIQQQLERAQRSRLNLEDLKRKQKAQFEKSLAEVSRMSKKLVQLQVNVKELLLRVVLLDKITTKVLMPLEGVRRKAAEEGRAKLVSSQMTVEQERAALRGIEEVVLEAKRMKEEKRRLAKDITKPEVRELTEEFAGIADDLEAILTTMEAKRQQLELMDTPDQNAVVRHGEACKTLEELQSKLSVVDENRVHREESMSQRREEWLLGIRELVHKIHTNFDRFMAFLKCRGGVSLVEPQEPNDFRGYGISIEVAFRRDEELRKLQGHVHSGGERSASTVLYMLALQELTAVPFRFVDEINQGMDEFNERKVFEVMTSIACRENCSQYFVLTPKLLPNLNLAANLSVGIAWREGKRCTVETRSNEEAIDIVAAYLQEFQ